MKNLLLAVTGFCLTASLSFGSTILDPLVLSNGSEYTVAYDSFTDTGNDLGGIQITATFGNSTSNTCTWVDATSDCVGTGFKVTFGANTNTDPAAGSLASSVWTITDTSTTLDLTNITIDAVVGNQAFDRCAYQVNGTGPLLFDDTDAVGNNVCYGTTNGSHNTAEAGTNGSNVGYSVHSGTGGTTSATANAAYTDILHLNAQNPVGDAYGELELSFNGTFSHNQTFTFGADTDPLTSHSLDDPPSVPEPATMGLVGLALAGLGTFRLKKRS